MDYHGSALYTHLKQKSSSVTYCKQEDQFNQLIAKLIKITSQIEDQIENGDRSAKIRTSLLGFIKTMEEAKAVCLSITKDSFKQKGAFQRQKLLEGDEVRWMSTTQKWLGYLESVEKRSAHSDNLRDPVETTETSIMMANDETIETENGKGC